MKYREKTIEAFRLCIDDVPDWIVRIVPFPDCNLVRVHIGDGRMLMANIGDYCILDYHGDIRTCQASSFESRYEPVEE